jgi:hypothetical protein
MPLKQLFYPRNNVWAMVGQIFNLTHKINDASPFAAREIFKEPLSMPFMDDKTGICFFSERRKTNKDIPFLLKLHPVATSAECCEIYGL